MGIATRLALYLLKSKRLSKGDRVALTQEVMHSLDAAPLQDILRVDEQNRLLVRGKPVDLELAIKLKESAAQTLNSVARNLVHEQVARLAFLLGMHKATDFDQVLFYKAALWWGDQEDKLLRAMAQDSTL